MSLRQQINLYQGAVRRESPAFGARAMAVSLVVCVGALGAAWFYALGHARELNATLASVQQQEVAAARRLEHVASTVAGFHGNESESLSLRDALDALARRERLLALLDGPGLGDTAGFSAPLRALAANGLDGLWLTRILVSAPQTRTTLEGRAREPGLVPEYLLSLSAAGALSGQRFDQFEIQRNEDPAQSAVHFSMTSAPAERFANRGAAQ